MNIQTLSYYERRGLPPDPGRTGGGYRVYGPGAVRIVRFVKRARELGFALTEIEILLDLADGGPDSCETTRQLATAKITELDGKITHLEAMRASLARLADTCTRPRADRDCPLLHSLDPSFDDFEDTTEDTMTTRDVSRAAVSREERRP